MAVKDWKAIGNLTRVRTHYFHTCERCGRTRPIKTNYPPKRICQACSRYEVLELCTLCGEEYYSGSAIKSHIRRCKKEHSYFTPSGKPLSPVVWAWITLKAYTRLIPEHRLLSTAVAHAKALWIYYNATNRYYGVEIGWLNREYDDAAERALEWLSRFDASIEEMLRDCEDDVQS